MMGWLVGLDWIGLVWSNVVCNDMKVFKRSPLSRYRIGLVVGHHMRWIKWSRPLIRVKRGQQFLTQRYTGGGKADRRHGYGTNYNTIQQLLCGWTTTVVPIKLFGSCRLSRAGERPIGSPMMIETRSWRRRSIGKGKEVTRFSNGIGLD